MLFHGAVEDFWLMATWLEACRTNNSPMVIEAIYVITVNFLVLDTEMLTTDHGNGKGVMDYGHISDGNLQVG